MISETTNGAQPISQIINQSIEQKVNYLQELKQAVANHADQAIYALLDQKRYAAEIMHREEKANDTGVMTLVDDLTAQLSNYLSTKLINYLSQAYPFFYYEEYQLGHYRMYFGNWWDRRQFGELDVLNIRFVFDQSEYAKLAKSFELAQAGQRYNGQRIEELSKENDRLQALIDSADKRDAKRRIASGVKEASARNGLFESSKNRETREAIVAKLSELENQDEEARTAAGKIKANNQQVLELSKENTILSYERKSIVDTFGSFEDFELANGNFTLAIYKVWSRMESRWKLMTKQMISTATEQVTSLTASLTTGLKLGERYVQLLDQLATATVPTELLDAAGQLAEFDLNHAYVKFPQHYQPEDYYLLLMGRLLELAGIGDFAVKPDPMHRRLAMRLTTFENDYTFCFEQKRSRPGAFFCEQTDHEPLFNGLAPQFTI